MGRINKTTITWNASECKLDEIHLIHFLRKYASQRHAFPLLGTKMVPPIISPLCALSILHLHTSPLMAIEIQVSVVVSSVTAPIHFRTELCDPISCYGKPLERTNEFGSLSFDYTLAQIVWSYFYLSYHFIRDARLFLLWECKTSSVTELIFVDVNLFFKSY